MKKNLKKIVIFILRLEANLILARFKPKIIALTGTTGKSSTKEAIALALGSEFDVRKSEKSYNSEIGVPLTVIGVSSGWSSLRQWIVIILKGWRVFLFSKNYPKFLILEIGVDKPGDMKSMMSWIKPNVAIVTALGETPVHVHNFTDPEQLMNEKRKIVEGMTKDDWAVLCVDDKKVASFKQKTIAQTITYGFSDSADLIVSDYKMSVDGISFKINYLGNVIPVRLFGLFGQQNVYVILAAISVGLIYKINPIKIIKTLSELKPLAGRMNLIEGINGSKIFDDSYNSSPLALEMAINTLAEYQAKRRIAVLGDMTELGKFSHSEHEKIGEKLREKNVWILFTIGSEARFIADGARKSGFDYAKIFEFSDISEAAVSIKSIIQEGDLILVKGSQAARMEKIVDKIMAHPENKDSLLVRQEAEWGKR